MALSFARPSLKHNHLSLINRDDNHNNDDHDVSDDDDDGDDKW